jgi:hypothetical protein
MQHGASVLVMQSAAAGLQPCVCVAPRSPHLAPGPGGAHAQRWQRERTRGLLLQRRALVLLRPQARSTWEILTGRRTPQPAGRPTGAVYSLRMGNQLVVEVVAW